MRPARQAKLLPPRHPPLEPGLFGWAGPARIKTSRRFYIWGIGGLEGGNKAENCRISTHMFQLSQFLASLTARLCCPPCFPSSRLFGITLGAGGKRGLQCVRVSAHCKKSCTAVAGAKGQLAPLPKKPAYISSVSKALGVWVKTLHPASPAPSGCRCAFGFVAGRWHGGGMRPSGKTGVSLGLIPGLPVGFCQQEAAFGLTRRSPRNGQKGGKAAACYGWRLLRRAKMDLGLLVRALVALGSPGAGGWPGGTSRASSCELAKVGCSVGMAEHPNPEQARDRFWSHLPALSPRFRMACCIPPAPLGLRYLLASPYKDFSPPPCPVLTATQTCQVTASKPLVLLL